MVNTFLNTFGKLFKTNSKSGCGFGKLLLSSKDLF